MKRQSTRLAALTFFVLSIAGSAVAETLTAFYYTSSPSSWVGHGETVLVTPTDDFDFFVSRNFDEGVSFAINDFARNPDFFSQRWWYLDFAAPFAQPLQLGHYAGAMRFPFQDIDKPGLSFIGNGRGDNMLSGFFDVLEIVYAADGSVVSFAADFTQFDENIPDWWNRGSIRFNSSIAISQVPEPQMSTLLAIGVIAMTVFARVQRRTAAVRRDADR